jgi:hypothetical protein
LKPAIGTNPVAGFLVIIKSIKHEYTKAVCMSQMWRHTLSGR